MNSLKIALRLNAMSCISFGLLGFLIPARISTFLGDPPVSLLQALGAVLIVNGLHLIIASSRTTLKEWEVVYFSLGDLVWWLGSNFLISANVWITTPVGAITMFVIALGVAVIGVMQIWLMATLKKQRSSANTGPS